ncbi:MAG: N-formylglutamate amidohydrolase [Micavibrio sp.]
MTALDKKTLQGIYTSLRPAGVLPLVFDSPHSGTDYPADFDYACDFTLVEKAEDKYVDELFAAAPSHGAALLCAHFPRSYIDANRCEKDIDLNLLEDLWPEEASPTARSHAGIGLIRRFIRPGIPLYDRSLKADEIKERITRYYRPYHAELQRLLDNAYAEFGAVWHVNCHSMPAQDSRNGRAHPFPRPDFVLGDRDGTSCDLDFTHAVRDFLKEMGYRVAVNDPYKGVELVRRYACPSRGRHSLQIEIARSLYMDEKTYRKSKNFNRLKDDIDKLIAFFAHYVSASSIPMAAD